MVSHPWGVSVHVFTTARPVGWVLAFINCGICSKAVRIDLALSMAHFSLLHCRYRNFRTFTSPDAVQFSCLTVDSSGEVVCSGSLDTFDVFVWSMKTGRLLEVISPLEDKKKNVILRDEVFKLYYYKAVIITVTVSCSCLCFFLLFIIFFWGGGTLK